MGRQGPVHCVGEDQIGLAGLQADFQNLLPQRPCINIADRLAGLWRAHGEFFTIADRFHELVGDRDAVVEVERLAVEIAGGLADFEKFFDLGVVDIEIDRRRAAPQRALANGKGEAVHDPNKGDDARGLASALNLFPNGANAAPIGADTAAVCCEKDILVPGANNAIEAIWDRIEEARNRQSAIRAAIRQNRGGGHEPQIGNIVIDALGVIGVIGKGRRHAGEHVLIALAGQEVAVLQGGLAEIGQAGVARPVDLHRFYQRQLGSLGTHSGFTLARLGGVGNLQSFSCRHSQKPQIQSNRQTAQKRPLAASNHTSSRRVVPKPDIWCSNPPVSSTV